MKRLLLVAPLLLGALSLACGSTDSDPELEIDPVSSCSGSKCAKKDAGKDDEVDPSTPSTPAKSDAGTSTPAPTSDGGTTTTTDTPNTCETAINLGQMNGEPKLANQPADKFSAQGHCSKWLKLRVNEDSSGLQALQLKATLISPPNHKFNLYAYVNPDEDVLECTTPLASSESTLSSIDDLTLTWGDSWFSDDSRTVTIEVRATDSCDDKSSWSLLLSSATMQQ